MPCVSGVAKRLFVWLRVLQLHEIGCLDRV
jgi:hypothetical protein